MKVIFVLVIAIFVDRSLAALKDFSNKEHAKNNPVDEYLKSGITPEKYDGAIYDDTNIVVVEDSGVEDSDAEDEPRLFDFRIPSAGMYRGRSKRSPEMDSGFFQEAGAGAKVGTGVAPVQTAATEGLVSYDAHVDPDFPSSAPVARGLKNVPEGWNLDKDVDEEFRTGFRRASTGQNPSYAAQGRAVGHAATNAGQGGQSGQVEIEGPYIMTSSGLAPFTGGYSSSSGGYGYGSSVGGYGGSPGGYGGSLGGYGGSPGGYGGSLGGYGGSPGGYGGSLGGYGNSFGGYGSSVGGYGSSLGGYGGSLGGYGSSFGGSYGSSLQQAAAANLGIGATNLFG